MTFTRWDAVRHALTIAGLAYIAAVWLRLVPYAEPVPAYGPMFDAYGIWNAWLPGGLYDIPWLDYEAYVYSPAFAQIIYPFTLLPWELFAALWTGLAIGILFWMRVPWMLAFPRGRGRHPAGQHPRLPGRGGVPCAPGTTLGSGRLGVRVPHQGDARDRGWCGTQCGGSGAGSGSRWG